MTHEILEREYAEWIGKKYAVAVNSGTSALHLALIAIGVTKGDEVIVPDFAFAAVAFAVSYVGATPVFVDCGDDYNIDVSLVKITPKTKAIIGVHTYGRLCDINSLKKFGVPVIEDACEAQGAKVGEGDITVFSFYKNKVLPGEEGGMALTDNKDWADRMRHLRNYAHEGGRYYHTELGFNYRLPESTAKVALDSLRNREYILSIRRALDQYYAEEFGTKTHESPWVFDFKTDKLDKILEIPGTRCFFKPQSTYPIYNQDPTPNSLKLSQTGFVVNLDHTKPFSYHVDLVKKIKDSLNS